MTNLKSLKEVMMSS